MKRFLLVVCLLAAVLPSGAAIDSPSVVVQLTADSSVVFDTQAPTVTLSRWDGEGLLRLRYTGLSSPLSYQNGEAHWIDGHQELRAYTVGNDSVEVEIVLFEKPESNEFHFTVDADELNFFPQPAIEKGRPENVIDSIAVYHRWKRDHIIGERNYQAGKLWHIYRINAVDACGRAVWGTQRVADGIYTVTVPQEFLDSASYPVVIDPTFGYTSVGASTSGLGNDYVLGFGHWAPASDGTASSVSIYYSGAPTSGVRTTTGIYAETSSLPNALLKDTGGTSADPPTNNWETSNLDSSLSVTNGTNYWIGQNHSVDSLTFAWDAGTQSVQYKSSAYSSGALPATFGTPDGSLASQQFSAYVTYSTAGATPHGLMTMGAGN